MHHGKPKRENPANTDPSKIRCLPVTQLPHLLIYFSLRLVNPLEIQDGWFYRCLTVEVVEVSGSMVVVVIVDVEVEVVVEVLEVVVEL